MGSIKLFYAFHKWMLNILVCDTVVLSYHNELYK